MRVAQTYDANTNFLNYENLKPLATSSPLGSGNVEIRIENLITTTIKKNVEKELTYRPTNQVDHLEKYELAF